MAPSKDGRTISDVRAPRLIGRLRGELPVQYILSHWQLEFAVGRHLVFAFLFDLQMQYLH